MLLCERRLERLRALCLHYTGTGKEKPSGHQGWGGEGEQQSTEDFRGGETVPEATAVVADDIILNTAVKTRAEHTAGGEQRADVRPRGG